MRVGVQTYTVRAAMRRDLAGTLAALRALGVTRVELARIGFTPAEAALVRASGMEVTSVQVKPKTLRDEPERIVAFCRAVACDLVVVSVLSNAAILGGAQAVRAFATFLNGRAERFARDGIRLAFHHHAFEFRKLGSRRKFDLLLDRTAPAIGFVVDTYWVRKAGVDPAAWIKRLGGRVAGLHLRDCVLPDRRFGRVRDGALGSGCVDFALVLRAAEHVPYAVIEQNSVHPFDDLKSSIAHLRALGDPHIEF